MPPRRRVAVGARPDVKLGVEDEAAVIGAALTDKPTRRRVVTMLETEDFIDDKHRVLFAVVKEMARRGMDWGEDAVASIHNRREDWGGFDYLRMLKASYGSGPLANLEYHVERIKLTRLRNHMLREVGKQIVTLAEDPRTTAEDFVELGAQVVARASTLTNVRRFNSQRATASTWQAFKARREKEATKIGFCCEAMDSVFSFGLAPGRCSVLGAQAGCGKTTLAVALARRRINEASLGTCYIACEMSDETEIPLMFASADLRIPFLRLLNEAHAMSDEEVAELRKYLSDFHSVGPDAFEIVMNPFEHDVVDARQEDGKKQRLWPGDLNRRNLAILESIIASTPHQLVILDMVGHALIEEDVQLLNRGLLAIKGFAERHRVHVLMLHHVNRGDLRAKNPRPTMRSFRGASGFENYLHNVMLAHRPRGAQQRGAAKAGSKEPFEISLAKQKVGGEAIVVYDYEPDFMDFTNGKVRYRGNAAKAVEDGDEEGMGDIK